MHIPGWALALEIVVFGVLPLAVVGILVWRQHRAYVTHRTFSHFIGEQELEELPLKEEPRGVHRREP